MKLTRSTAGRDGFTLVELMIAAAITVMIMTILSICFQTSMNAMSSMRAQGDAADQLRALNTVMKRDFMADRHLPAEGNQTVRNRGRRISDYLLQMPTVPPPPPPATGFFYLDSPPPIASQYEGSDGAFDSYRNAPNTSYPTGCRVWFTSVLPGGDDSKLYTATVNGVTYSSEAAEVAYFLLPAPQQTGGNPSLQLYNLHRRQRLVAIDSQRQSVLSPVLAFAGASEVISQNQANLAQANTMTTLTLGGRSPTLGPSSIFQLLASGDDIILSNVLSFEIKPTWTHRTFLRDPVPFIGRPAAPGYPAYGPNTDFPYDDLTKATNNAGHTYDSITGMPVRMNAMQIRIRIYDIKVKTARQMTLIVDL